MEGQVVLMTPSELKLMMVEAVSIALKYHHPEPTGGPVNTGTLIDFSGLLKEYYPGIPASTVRQDTARLGRTKIGKRILFDRAEIEEHLRQKRRMSSTEMDQEADGRFSTIHQRRGGHKAA